MFYRCLNFKSRLLIVCLCFLVVGTASGEKIDKPNILMILVDDLKPAMGVYGDTMAVSPNLDRLASRGMRFERF